MKYYITEGDVNWADEIDFEGFDLFTEDELKDAKKSFSAGPKKIKSVTVSIVFLSICHEVMGPDAMIFVF